MKRLANAAAAGVWGVLAFVIGVNIANARRYRSLREEAEARTRASAGAR